MRGDIADVLVTRQGCCDEESFFLCVVIWPKKREASIIRSVGEGDARSDEQEVWLKVVW